MDGGDLLGPARSKRDLRGGEALFVEELKKMLEEVRRHYSQVYLMVSMPFERIGQQATKVVAHR